MTLDDYKKWWYRERENSKYVRVKEKEKKKKEENLTKTRECNKGWKWTALGLMRSSYNIKIQIKVWKGD